jgi:hypothetical protein
LQAAFRRAIAGQAGFVRAEVLDVVGQLVMQETGGINAGDGDQAKVGDWRDHAVGEVGFGQRRTEVFDLGGFVLMEAGAQRGEVFDPVAHKFRIISRLGFIITASL